MNPYTLWWAYDRLGFGPGIGHTESGHNLFWAVYNTRFSLRAGLHDLFGWPYLSWLLLPFGLLALRRKAGGRLLAAIPLALILFYGAYWIGSWLLGPRYYAESLPMLCIIGAAGAAWLVGSERVERGVKRWRGPLVSGLVLLLIGINVLWYLPVRVGGMKGLYNITRGPSEALASQELG